MPNLNDGLYGSFETAKKLGVSIERLRYWENAGIVQPRYVQCGSRRFRRYSLEDLTKAHFVKTLLDQDKYSLQGALCKLNNTASGQEEFTFAKEVYHHTKLRI